MEKRGGDNVNKYEKKLKRLGYKKRFNEQAIWETDLAPDQCQNCGEVNFPYEQLKYDHKSGTSKICLYLCACGQRWRCGWADLPG